MKMPIMLKLIKNKNPQEFYTPERCHIVELLNDDSSPQLSMARCRVEPAVTTQLHALRATGESYFIEQGMGEMNDGGDVWIKVSKGDLVIIPSGHPQRIRNIGTQDLIFLVLCRPKFEAECYQNLEE